MTKMVRRGNPVRSLRAAVLALLLVGGGGAWAQGLDFKVPEFDFLNDGKSFGPGVTPYAEIENFQRSLYPNLRARLFWKDEVVRKPRSVAARGPDGPDRCYIFNSTVLRARPTSTEIYLDGMPRIAGDWIVVFESGQWTKGPIKISSRAMDEYFHRGFSFSTESPKSSWNWSPFGFIALIAPQRVARQAADKQKQEKEKQAHQLAAQNEALAHVADDPLCVWFRPTSQNFLVAEKRPCGGCSPEEPRRAEIAAQWFTRTMIWAR